MRKTIVVATALILVQISLLAYVFQQERTWGGLDRDGANGVAVAGDGSVYVTGETRSFGAGSGDSDALLLKYNASGTMVRPLSRVLWAILVSSARCSSSLRLRRGAWLFHVPLRYSGMCTFSR